jgi:hypothetical protein
MIEIFNKRLSGIKYLNNVRNSIDEKEEGRGGLLFKDVGSHERRKI